MLSVNILQRHSTFVLICFEMALAARLLKAMQSDAKGCKAMQRLLPGQAFTLLYRLCDAPAPAVVRP